MAVTEFDHQNLRARLAAMPRDAILSGKPKPGDCVVESQLAKELALGQPSIREGLQMLDRFSVKEIRKGIAEHAASHAL
ncbi:MAG: hypothetical protein ACKV22_35515 [Bryobacteraceae bacterium]